MRIVTMILCLSAACALAPGSARAGGDGADRSWSFRVYLDDREIGVHEFRVTRTPSATWLDSEARFEVKLLFITAFEYRHEAHEQWDESGCLVGIRAETRENSDRQALEGHEEGDVFALRKVELDRQTRRVRQAVSEAEPVTYETDCVSSFAYWDPAFLQRDRLLNPQTGELTPVEVESLGRQRMTVAGVDVPVERYRLTMPEGEVEVSYAQAGGRREWVALESPIEGRRLRYVREDVDELPRLLLSVAGEHSLQDARHAGAP